MTNHKQNQNLKYQRELFGFLELGTWNLLEIWNLKFGTFRARSGARGYTLIEMLMVIAIATMTLIAVVTATTYFYRANRVVFNQALAVESARSGLSSASKDIRGARYGDDGSYPVSAIATSSFTFYDDTNGDGSAEKVSYILSGTNFVRGVIYATGTPATYPGSAQSTTTAASSVQNGPEGVAIFRFYTASSTEITTFSTTTAVSYVTITLVVDVDPDNQPAGYTLYTTAALRNATNF